ncbi:MAG: hypothetical protein J0L82_15915 [Deltaproteobacteria bacterium]|nr:hypothetical protein [Deltaproteobacteria bacterium]
MMQSLDTALHLTCETYSSGAQLRDYPRYSRHLIGAMYCWLLKLPEVRFQEFVVNANSGDFSAALLAGFNPLDEHESRLRKCIEGFLPRFSYDHGRLAKNVIESVRSAGLRDQAFEYVFRLFDQTVNSRDDREAWDIACRALCRLPENEA